MPVVASGQRCSGEVVALGLHRFSAQDAGGYTFSAGGAYSLGGTIGQADAGVMSGGTYTLVGGFWGGATAQVYRIYLPLVMHGA